MAVEATNPDGSTRIRLDQLPRQAQLAGWPTPKCTEINAQRSDPDRQRRSLAHDGLGATPIYLAGWNKPMAGSSAKPTHNATSSTDSSRATEWQVGKPVAGAGEHLQPVEDWQPMRFTSEGTLLIGSFAGMDTGGQLRPEHSRWLMRIPPEWDACAPTETASTLKRRRNSIEPSAT